MMLEDGNVAQNGGTEAVDDEDVPKKEAMATRRLRCIILLDLLLEVSCIILNNGRRARM